MNKVFTREQLQAHVFKRLKESSLVRPNEFREDVLAIAWEMANSGMINYERGFFTCFGLVR